MTTVVSNTAGRRGVMRLRRTASDRGFRDWELGIGIHLPIPPFPVPRSQFPVPSSQFPVPSSVYCRMIGFGCMRLSTAADRDAHDGAVVIHAALDAGARLLDTADAYCHDERDVGHNERMIAAAL